MLAGTCSAIGRVVGAMAMGMRGGLLWVCLALLAEIGAALLAGPGAGLLLVLACSVGAVLVTASAWASRWAGPSDPGRLLALRWSIRYGCSGPMLAYLVFISVPGFHSADTLFFCVLPLGAAIGLAFGAAGGAVEGWVGMRRGTTGSGQPSAHL
jgi:hypothetical protein